MGVLNVKLLLEDERKAEYINQLVNDIEALDIMLEKGMIEEEPIRIGAEQEFCIVDKNYNPHTGSKEVLGLINDEHFTTEIGKFNLEINSDPLELKDNCFSQLEEAIIEMVQKAEAAAEKINAKVVLTGILPTLSLKHMKLDHMTEMKRYKVLNESIKKSRKGNFEIHIKGVDELNLLHDSVMLEGCNTSFQAHLQINPNDFVKSYNWSQAIAGPVLSICTNSPMIFGKELWAETRIALFTQSVDTRANSFLLNEKQSRVSFGTDWARGTASSIFKDNVSRFRSLITAENLEDSLEQLKEGKIPKLRAMNLHGGTVYTWNRACYGVGGGKPHLRIENRYIPSGPSVADEVANMMFWVGLMKARPKEFDNIEQIMDFRDARSNFFNAARYGMATQFKWMNQFIPSHKLILDVLLPLSYKGLYSVGIDPKDAEHYLSIIENRVNSQTGSEWIVKNYRKLLEDHKPFEAAQILTAHMHEKQTKNYPVSSWSMIPKHHYSVPESNYLVKHRMTTKVISVSEFDSCLLVKRIMEWNNIHHMPVVNEKKELIGILSMKDLNTHCKGKQDFDKMVGSIMIKEVISIEQDEPIIKARALFKTHNFRSLPVLQDEKLIGIITQNDL